jgi:hypothetical protein
MDYNATLHRLPNLSFICHGDDMQSNISEVYWGHSFMNRKRHHYAKNTCTHNEVYFIRPGLSLSFHLHRSLQYKSPSHYSRLLSRGMLLNNIIPLIVHLQSVVQGEGLTIWAICKWPYHSFSSSSTLIYHHAVKSIFRRYQTLGASLAPHSLNSVLMLTKGSHQK